MNVKDKEKENLSQDDQTKSKDVVNDIKNSESKKVSLSSNKFSNGEIYFKEPWGGASSFPSF